MNLAQLIINLVFLGWLIALSKMVMVLLTGLYDVVTNEQEHIERMETVLKELRNLLTIINRAVKKANGGRKAN